MRLKTFTADSMPEALRLIKRDLGSDAVILNTRKIKRGSHYGLEITAAIDQPAPLPEREDKVGSTPFSFSLDDAQQAAMHRTAEQSDLKTSLTAHGIEGSFVDSFIKAQEGLLAADFSVSDSLEMVLNKRLDLKPLSQVFQQGRVHVFVGPTGAGKTTFVGKVAVWGKRGKQSVGVLSLDSQKIGGVEPLHVLADALGDTAHVIQSAEDLKPLAATLGKRQLILVDTPGLNPYNKTQLNLFEKQLKDLSAKPVVHLVLPCGMSLVELKNAMAAFYRMDENLRPQNVVFTKLDESSTMGNIVNVLTMNTTISGGVVGRSASMADGPVCLTAADLATSLLEAPRQIWEDFA